jgi:hypothetical protein
MDYVPRISDRIAGVASVPFDRVDEAPHMVTSFIFAPRWRRRESTVSPYSTHLLFEVGEITDGILREEPLSVRVNEPCLYCRRANKCS